METEDLKNSIQGGEIMIDKIVRITDVNIDKKAELEKTDSFRAYTDEEKKKIGDYLTRTPCAYTTQPVIDLLTGEKPGGIDDMISDGVYTWYVGEVYYFKKYGLRLKQEFIDYVMQK